MPTNDKERDFEEINSKLKFPGRFDPALLQNKIIEDGFPGLQLAIRNWVKYYLHEAQMEQDLDLNTKKGINLVDGTVASDAMAFGQKTVNLADMDEKDHASLASVTSDQHHAQAHTLASHSTKAHSELSDAPTSAHHVKTVSGEISLGSLLEKNHASLASVTSDQHHPKQHTINTVADHTSSAIPNKILIADANGLPVDGTNTNTEVSDAVTASHAQSHALDSHTVPVADLPMNAKKITGLGDGVAASDAMAFGQKTVNLADLNEKSYNNLDDLPEIGVGIASTTIIHSNDAEKSTTGTVAQKIKEIVSYSNLAGVRVSWEHKSSNPEETHKTYLYVNGISKVSGGNCTGSYVEVYGDLVDIVYGDLIQIYGEAKVLGTVFAQNMKIKFDEFVNNDP